MTMLLIRLSRSIPHLFSLQQLRLRICIVLFSFSCVFTPALSANDTVRVLFIGNSYTSVNQLPSLIATMAAAKGKFLKYDAHIPDGSSFQRHCRQSEVARLLQSDRWDYVVLQEQSQAPSFPPAQVERDVYPFAVQLDSMIKAANPQSKTVFYMTWGRKNGDAFNGDVYPTVATYEGMQGRLRESYLEMTRRCNAWCAPVGVAWQTVRQQHPDIELYTADESHPSLNGSFLAASVFYAVLFQDSTTTQTDILPHNTASVLQNIAIRTVFDSLSLWNIPAVSPASFPDHLSNPSAVFFPNPVTEMGNLWLQIPAENILSAQAVDLNGNVYNLTFETDHETTKMDMKSLPQGIFLVRVRTKNGVFAQKIQHRNP